MADIKTMKTLFDLYGVGVRAGVLTPQMVDEEYFRKLADFPEMSAEVEADWKSTGGVRHPMTIIPPEEQTNEI